MDVQEFKEKIAEIYKIANELGRAFGIDRCTPDGHLLGAIGQIAAKIAFNLEFGRPKDEHNCTWSTGSKKIDVQVRCTGRGSIALRKEPDHLIALEIAESGRIRLLFNGPGNSVWSRIEHQKNSQKYVSLKVVVQAQQAVDVKDRIPIVKNIFD
ncbi:MAG: hypothetical protein WCF59_00645 [Desulfobaccales bacterium]